MLKSKEETFYKKYGIENLNKKDIEIVKKISGEMMTVGMNKLSTFVTF